MICTLTSLLLQGCIVVHWSPVVLVKSGRLGSLLTCPWEDGHTLHPAILVWCLLPVSLYGISTGPGVHWAPCNRQHHPQQLVLPSFSKEACALKRTCSSECGGLSATTKEPGIACGKVSVQWSYCPVMWCPVFHSLSRPTIATYICCKWMWQLHVDRATLWCVCPPFWPHCMLPASVACKSQHWGDPTNSINRPAAFKSLHRNMTTCYLHTEATVVSLALS